MSKGKYRRKKSPVEAHGYCKMIENTTVKSDHTYLERTNFNLRGSDEISEEKVIEPDNSVQSVLPKPFRYHVEDWFKENIIGIVITMIIIPIFGFLIYNVINLNIKDTYVEHEIEEVRSDIESIKSNTVEKEMLNYKLDSLKKDMENQNKINELTVTNKLDSLKQEIETIKNKQ